MVIVLYDMSILFSSRSNPQFFIYNVVLAAFLGARLVPQTPNTLTTPYPARLDSRHLHDIYIYIYIDTIDTHIH